MNFILRHEGWTGRATGLALGAIAICGQAPLHFWPVTLMCLAVLYLRLNYASQSAKPRKAGFHSAMWFALGYFGVSIFWVGSAFIARGPAFIPIMPPMVIGLAALLAVFWAQAGAIYAQGLAKTSHVKMGNAGLWRVLAFTSLFFLAEFARGHLFGGLPWNLTGYIFKAGGAPSQIAIWINIYGLTWLVLFFAACLGHAASVLIWPQQASSQKPAFIAGLTACLGLIGLFSYGHLRLSGANHDMVEGVKIRIVSVPFDQAEQFDPQRSLEITRQFLTQSLAAGVEDVSHIVWPEGAVLGLAMDDYALLQAMGRGLVQYDDTPPVWLLQSLRYDSQADPKTGKIAEHYYNSSVAIEFDAFGNPKISGYNDKHRLVPFGEFIPGGAWLQSHLPVISAGLTSMTPAPRKALSSFPGLPRLSAQICYEAIFTGSTTIDKDDPARLILNQSNDAWYGNSWGPWQHANMAKYRAIEQGLPMIRVASNGVSGIINPYGRLNKSLSSHDLSHIDEQLPKSLKINKNTKVITLILGLLNLLISLMWPGLFSWGKPAKY